MKTQAFHWICAAQLVARASLEPWAILVASEEMDDVEEKVMPTEPEPKSKMAPVPKKSDIPEMKVFSASWLEISWVRYSCGKRFARLSFFSRFDRFQICQRCKTTSPPHWTCNSKAPRRSGRHFMCLQIMYNNVTESHILRILLYACIMHIFVSYTVCISGCQICNPSLSCQGRIVRRCWDTRGCWNTRGCWDTRVTRETRGCWGTQPENVFTSRIDCKWRSWQAAEPNSSQDGWSVPLHDMGMVQPW